MNPGQAFLHGTPIPGVVFAHNDFVQIVAGKHKGATGSLVTVIATEQEQLFIVELESGFDVEALQSEIRAAK